MKKYTKYDVLNQKISFKPVTKEQYKKKLNNMYELTIDKLNEIPYNTVFASGYGFIEHPYFNDAKFVSKGGTLEEDGKMTKVKWVATKRGNNDWDVCHSMNANFIKARYLDDGCHLNVDDDYISKWGNRITDINFIKEHFICTEEVLNRFRRY